MEEVEYREERTLLTEPIRDARSIENYDVRIETLDYGYVVCVGCKRFAISSQEIMLSMITKYLNNPGQLQKEFFDKTLEIK